MDEISLTYNFDKKCPNLHYVLILCFYLFSLIFYFFHKCQPSKLIQILATLGPKSLPTCFRFLVKFTYICIIKRDYNIYLNKHRWNRILLPISHQYGSSLVTRTGSVFLILKTMCHHFECLAKMVNHVKFRSVFF